jgi:hypothetical protein
VEERSGGTGRRHPPELKLLGTETRTQIHDRTDEERMRITRQTVGGDGGVENSGQRLEKYPHEQREDVDD